jgi:hypothetical protein
MDEIKDRSKAKLFKIINYKPLHSVFYKFHNSDKKIRLAIGGKRAGKSTAFVVEFLYYLLTNGANKNYWIVAVDYKQTNRFMFGSSDLKGVANYLDEYFNSLIKSRSLRDHFILLKTNSLIQGKSTKYLSSFSAEKVDGIIIEDAEPMSNLVWELIFPRVADSGGFIFINTNPPENKAHFVYELSKEEFVETINPLTTENPYVNDEVIANMKKSLPLDAFQRAIGKITTKTERILEKAVFEGEIAEYDSSCLYTAGMDVALLGRTRTVLAIANVSKKRIDFVEFFPKQALKKEEFYKRVLEILKAYNNPVLNKDGSGIGFSVYEELKRLNYPVINGAINSLKRRNYLIELLMNCIDKGWTFCNNELMKMEFYNLETNFEINKNTYEVMVHYLPHNKEILTDSIFAVALALEKANEYNYIEYDKNKSLKVDTIKISHTLNEPNLVTITEEELSELENIESY